MKKVNLGIIGLGNIGKLHLKNCLQLSNVNVVAAADVSKRALSYAKAVGVKKTYSNYEHLLSDSQVDSVIIALPNHFHLQCACKAAEMKKNIFLEKPIARSISEAKEIISASQRNSIKIMVGYPLRFDPYFRELKEKITLGHFGDIEGAYAVNIGSGPFSERAEDKAPSPVPEWWFNKTLTGGGVLLDLGSHMINLLRWYLGEITDIKSHLSYRFNQDFEDAALCIAKFSSGTKGVIRLGWFSQEFQLKVELMGTAAHAQGHPIKKSNPLLTIGRALLRNNSTQLSPHLMEINHFVNSILNDFSPSPTAIEGLKDLEAISLAYKNKILL
jgi:predicted dehydrogenase